MTKEEIVKRLDDIMNYMDSAETEYTPGYDKVLDLRDDIIDEETRTVSKESQFSSFRFPEVRPRDEVINDFIEAVNNYIDKNSELIINSEEFEVSEFSLKQKRVLSSTEKDIIYNIAKEQGWVLKIDFSQLGHFNYKFKKRKYEN